MVLYQPASKFAFIFSVLPWRLGTGKQRQQQEELWYRRGLTEAPGQRRVCSRYDRRGNVWELRSIKVPVGWAENGLFNEEYRVVAVEAERLTVKGIITGTVLTIVNSDPAMPLSAEQYPLGKLVALSDPSASVPN